MYMVGQPALELAGTHEVVGFDDSAAGGEGERNCHLGGRLGQDARGVADRDPGARWRRQRRRCCSRRRSCCRRCRRRRRAWRRVRRSSASVSWPMAPSQRSPICSMISSSVRTSSDSHTSTEQSAATRMSSQRVPGSCLVTIDPPRAVRGCAPSIPGHQFSSISRSQFESWRLSAVQDLLRHPLACRPGSTKLHDVGTIVERASRPSPGELRAPPAATESSRSADVEHVLVARSGWVAASPARRSCGRSRPAGRPGSGR